MPRLLSFLYASFALSCISFHASLGQEAQGLTITGEYAEEPLLNIINEVENLSQARFYFIDAWIDEITVSGSYSNTSIDVFLKEVLKTSELDFVIYDPFTIVFTRDIAILQSLSVATPDIPDITVGQEKLFVLGKAVNLAGKLYNEKTEEPLNGAMIAFENIQRTAMTDESGNFEIQVPAGRYYITFEYPGLQAQRKLVSVFSDGQLDLNLYEEPIQLKEVSIESTAEDINIVSPYLGLIQINSGVIDKLPTLLGEADVVRTLLMMPGVNTVGEGATGLNVRGGNIDQNLITIDDSPIFNTSHLFGFFSTINPDALGEINFYKGSTPASYGGRASSVLDLKLKEGSADRLKLKGSAGTISSKVAIEGPIGKKTSFLASGRGSYVNWILRQIEDIDIRRSRANFGDFSVKLSHRFNEKAKLTYSSYYSSDSFKFAEDTVYRWSSFNNVAKFSYLFNERFVGSITAFDSNYTYEAENVSDIDPFLINYQLNQKTAKADFSILHENLTIDFGAGVDLYSIAPGMREPTTNESSISPLKLPSQTGMLIFQYANMEYRIASSISINAGMRLGSFSNTGPGQYFNYQEGQSRSTESIIDTTLVANNEKIASYSGLEPRASFRWKLNSSTSFKLGYARNFQYLYLVSNSAAATPLDVWRPADNFVPPLRSDQFSIGFFKNFMNNGLESSIEGYYKQLDNLVEYKDGAELLLNEALESELIVGEGKAYGVELLLKKNNGAVTGWLAYTYSRSLRKMDGMFPDEVLNDGDFYPSNFDSPHNASLILNWDMNDWFDVGLNFVYNTGRPVTAPVSKYFVNYLEGQNLIVAEFSDRNQFRIPDYYRLDISVTYRPKPQRLKKWDDSWTFSIYNVLGRKNPYSVFFQGGAGISAQAYQLSVIGVPIPAITYNFRFPKF